MEQEGPLHHRTWGVPSPQQVNATVVVETGSTDGWVCREPTPIDGLRDSAEAGFLGASLEREVGESLCAHGYGVPFDARAFAMGESYFKFEINDIDVGIKIKPI